MYPWRPVLFQTVMYFPAWLLAHFTRRSSRLREASAALGDTSLRKIAVAKRLGKVFSMGIRERLFEEGGHTWPPPSRDARRREWRTVQGCQSEVFFSSCKAHDSYKAAPKLAPCVWWDTYSNIWNTLKVPQYAVLFYISDLNRNIFFILC